MEFGSSLKQDRKSEHQIHLIYTEKAQYMVLNCYMNEKNIMKIVKTRAKQTHIWSFHILIE